MNFLVGSFQLAVSEVNLELPIFISEGLLVISNLKLVKTANCQLPTVFRRDLTLIMSLIG